MTNSAYMWGISRSKVDENKGPLLDNDNVILESESLLTTHFASVGDFVPLTFKRQTEMTGELFKDDDDDDEDDQG